MWAGLEAVGTLFVTVAAKIATLDEASCTVFTGLDFKAAIADFKNRDGNGRALVKASGRGRNACTRRTLFKLLHAQRNALLLDIDVENDCLDDFTLAMEVKRVFAGDSPCDVRHVDHAIDVAVETNEQAEFSGVLEDRKSTRLNSSH